MRVRFSWLAQQVAIANTHFHIGQHLVDAWRGPFKTELYESNIFWGYTVRAHWELALLCLCRVYDDYKDRRSRPDKEAFHLLRLVQEIDEAKLSDADKQQRKMDIEFLQAQNNGKLPDETVVKLRKWRNNLIAHTNAHLVEDGGDNFLKDNPFTRSEIQNLIDRAFSILKRWEDYYVERPPCYPVETTVRTLAADADDYVFVLESLQFRLRQSGVI